jgi:divalent metal cation (Fe/Co/Zn/Cd) transporter
MNNSVTTSGHVASGQSRAGLLRRGLSLEYVTLGWNVVGIIVVGVAALRASSVALAGFGLDSLIEIFASVVVIWDLTESKGHNEKRALRLIGAAFLALAAYVVVQTAYIFIAGGRPASSVLGIVWLAVTVLAMLLLAWGKRVTGRQLDNPVLIAESRVTVIDAYLAGAVLVGVALNALLGWWWADPLSGLVVVYYAMIEGVAHWREGSNVTALR